MGYEIDEAEVAYWGRCPDCLAADRAPSAPTHRHADASRRKDSTDNAATRPKTEVNVNMDNEQKCPFSAKAHSGRSNRDWWPNQLNLNALHTNHPAGDPMGEAFNYAEEFKSLDLDALKKDIDGGDDEVAGLVAGGLRPLRAAVHPHGVAQRGHLPHPRRPRRRRVGHAALRAPRQLAGQREPRQGAPAALADQAEVRPEDLVGRPDGPHRQRRPRVDGVQDVRLRRRARGRLGARAGQLGIRSHVARRRALQRRSAARESVRRRADGPHLRESRRAERQARIPSPPRGTFARPSAAWR